MRDQFRSANKSLHFSGDAKMADEPVEGGLFRHNYVREPFLLPDSDRARRRIWAAFQELSVNQITEFHRQLRRTVGPPLKTHLYISGQCNAFWNDSETADFLSAITVWYRCTSEYGNQRLQLLAFLRLVFKEEQLRYRIDDDCGVHFFVDEEFERSVQSTLAGLGQPKFRGAKEALEHGLNYLGAAQQSGKRLVREVFEAVETAFLVVVPDGQFNRLNAQAITEALKPILMQKYANEPEAENRVDRLLSNFEAWVHSAHPFRHGANIEDVHECPLDMAILLATQGMTFLRYLTKL